MNVAIVGRGVGKSILGKVLGALTIGGSGAMEAFGRLVSPHSTISAEAFAFPHRTAGSAMAGLLDRGEQFRNRPSFIKGIERKFNSRWV